MQRACSVQPKHIRREYERRGLDREHYSREAHGCGALDAARQPVVQEHYRNFRCRHKGVEPAHARLVPADTAHDVYHKIRHRVVPEEQQRDSEQQTAEPRVIPQKSNERAAVLAFVAVL